MSVIPEEKDVMGRPVVVIAIRKHNVLTRNLDDVRDYSVYNLESMCSLCHEDGPDNLCIVFDLTSFGLRCMDYTAVRMLTGILRNYYPERLGIGLILNAPLMFSACWYVIRTFIDQGTADKIKFVRTKEEISQYLDPAIIPRDL